MHKSKSKRKTRASTRSKLLISLLALLAVPVAATIAYKVLAPGPGRTPITAIPDPQLFPTPSAPSRLESPVPGPFPEKLVGKISIADCELWYDVARENALPRGSAMVTSSGALSRRGIRAIIHAAPGSDHNETAHFIPTTEAVATAIKNSLLLASENNFRSVAIPFIGGVIFLGRLGIQAPQLAKIILTAISASAYYRQDPNRVKIVLYADKDMEIFKTAQQELGSAIVLEKNNILDANTEAIVNAANMEVRFGGGISKSIGEATGEEIRIDQEAKENIKIFNEWLLNGKIHIV